MPITFTKEEREVILKLANKAVDLRNDYWDKLHEVESALGLQVDGLDRILEACPSEDCSDEEFQAFIKQCVDSSELMEDKEEVIL